MNKAVVAPWFLLIACALPAAAQMPPSATDLTAASVQAFLKTLPRDKISDSPIRVVDVGGYKIGVYGVFRAKELASGAVLHQTRMSEIYYILEGAGTLVTGGTLKAPTRQTKNNIGINLGSDGIEGGVSRRIGRGDIVIIPGGVPHWWSSLESDITYLIFRPDPDGQQTLK